MEVGLLYLTSEDEPPSRACSNADVLDDNYFMVE